MRGIVIAALTLVASTAVAQDLLPVDHPSLDSVEELVKADLVGARRTLESLQQAGGAAADLGRAWGELGEYYLVYDLSDAAAPCLENAAILLPGEVRWPYLLGSLHELDGRPALAAQWYRRARAVGPEYVPTLIRLGRLELASGELAAAREAFESALAKDGSSAAALQGLARLAAREDDPRAAAAAYERALALQPEASALHYPLSQAYRQLGDLDSARAQLELRGDQQVQFEDPVAYEVKRKAGGSAAQVFLANLALQEGSPEVAEAELRSALASNPNSAMVLSGLATVLESQGDLKGALEFQARAVENDPESTRDRAKLGEMLARAGRDAEAVVELERVVAQAPDHDEARRILADALGRLGRFSEALPHLDFLLSENPGSVDLRLRRVRVNDRLGNAVAVRADLELLLVSAPLTAVVHFRWGLVMLAEGNPAEALARFERAVELDPEMKEAWMNAAILLGREGRYRAAAAAQAEVVRIDPNDRDAHLTLGTARILGEEYALAKTGLLIALEKHRDDPRIADVLARLLAAAPDDTVRDGRLAVEVASKVLRVYPRAEFAQTLAMALAEVGDFVQALALQQRAVEELRERGPEAESALRKAEAWRESYRRGQPLRSPWKD